MTLPLFVDTHADTLSKIADLPGTLITGAETHADLPRWQEGRVALQVLAIWTRSRDYGQQALYHALKLAQAFHREAALSEGRLQLVRWAEDLDRLHFPDRIGGILSLESGAPFLEDLWLVDTFFELGVRMVGLTWNGRNALADGLGTADKPSGLTDFGREVVQRMETLGMIVDLAHIAEPGFWDVMEMAQKPVVVSHANARRLCDHRRNLYDEQLDAIAKSGGIVGVTFVPSFLAQDRVATLQDVLDNIVYMVERIGVDHVGIGSDFDGIDQTPEGLKDVSQMPAIARGLQARGLDDAAIAQIAGGNWLRLFKQIFPSAAV